MSHLGYLSSPTEGITHRLAQLTPKPEYNSTMKWRYGMKFRIPTLCGMAAVLLLMALPRAEALKPAKKHLLVVTWTTGFRHADTIGTPDKDGPAQGILKEIGDTSGV